MLTCVNTESAKHLQVKLLYLFSEGQCPDAFIGAANVTCISLRNDTTSMHLVLSCLM